MDTGQRCYIGNNSRKRQGTILDINHREVKVLLDIPEKCRVSDQFCKQLWFRRDVVVSVPQDFQEGNRMRKNDPISKLMTKDVKTVQVGQKLSDVRKLLTEHKFHHVPVLEGKRLVGLLSSTDLLKMSLEAYGTDSRTMDLVLDKQFAISSVMQQELITLNQKDTVREAAELLMSGQFHSLPVVDDQQNLVGIVTSTDLIRYLDEQYK